MPNAGAKAGPTLSVSYTKGGSTSEACESATLTQSLSCSWLPPLCSQCLTCTHPVYRLCTPLNIATFEQTNTTTTQSTATGARSIQVDPAANSCYDVTSVMTHFRRRVTNQFQAHFTKWVGFAGPCVYVPIQTFRL